MTEHRLGRQAMFQQPLSVPVVSPELPEETPLTTITRSGRSVRPTARYQQSLAQREQGIVAWEILVDQDERENIPTAKQQYELQVQLAEPIVYATSSDPDILYLHEAMKAPDRANSSSQWNEKSKDMKKATTGFSYPSNKYPKVPKFWMQFGLCVVNVE